MNGSDLNSFPLEARKNKRAIFSNMALLFSEPRVRASREKIISNPTALGSKLGFKPCTLEGSTLRIKTYIMTTAIFIALIPR